MMYSVGFFLDSYDLFIINLVTPIWTYEYVATNPLILDLRHSAPRCSASYLSSLSMIAKLASYFQYASACLEANHF